MFAEALVPTAHAAGRTPGDPSTSSHGGGVGEGESKGLLQDLGETAEAALQAVAHQRHAESGTQSAGVLRTQCRPTIYLIASGSSAAVDGVRGRRTNGSQAYKERLVSARGHSCKTAHRVYFSTECHWDLPLEPLAARTQSRLQVADGEFNFVAQMTSGRPRRRRRGRAGARQVTRRATPRAPSEIRLTAGATRCGGPLCCSPSSLKGLGAAPYRRIISASCQQQQCWCE